MYAEAWKMDITSIFAKIDAFKDFKCIFHYQRIPALVHLFSILIRMVTLIVRKKHLVLGLVSQSVT